MQLNTALFDRYYLENWKAIAFRKVINHTKYELPNVPNHLCSFWLNFYKANYSSLPSFLIRETNFQNIFPGVFSK